MTDIKGSTIHVQVEIGLAGIRGTMAEIQHGKTAGRNGRAIKYLILPKGVVASTEIATSSPASLPFLNVSALVVRGISIHDTSHPTIIHL